MTFQFWAPPTREVILLLGSGALLCLPLAVGGAKKWAIKWNINVVEISL